MRKVTASAVILTALTGCSQSSGIPSAQWSFELPSGDKTQAEATGTEGLSDDELSADAQSFLGGTFGKNMMGPAFEQPTVGDIASDGVASNVPVGSKVSSIGRPGSREISNIALETAGTTSTTSSRPDPVDRVRAYLRASGSPSALTNRTPYASQVYLSSSAATSSSADISNFPITLAPSNRPASSQASNSFPAVVPTIDPVMDPAVDPAVGPTIDPTPAITFESRAGNAFTTSASAGLNAASTGFDQDYSAALRFIDTQAAYGDVAYPTSANGATVALSQITPVAVEPTTPLPAEESQAFTGTAFTNTVDADGLPQLAPAQSNNLAFLNQAPQATPPIQEEDLSIGTSILRDLQRSSPAATSVNTSVNTANTATAPVEVDISSIEGNGSFSDIGDTSVSLVPSGSESSPTLASLRQTMPQREPSPLVIARQAATTSAPGLQLEFPDQSAVDSTDLEALNIEGINVLETQTSSPVINTIFESAPVAPSTAIEADLHSSSDGYSPLLEGLRTTESASTIYVPIAEELSSGDLIQNAVMALGQEVSTAALLEDLAFKNAFSSVLTSAALLSGESIPSQTPGETIAQTPVSSQSAQAGVIEITTAGTAPSQDITSFDSAANNSRLRLLQQGILKQDQSKRRQLITWR